MFCRHIFSESVSCYRCPLPKPHLRPAHTPIDRCIWPTPARMRLSFRSSQHLHFPISFFAAGARTRERKSIAHYRIRMSIPLRAAATENSAQQKGPAETENAVKGATTMELSSLNDTEERNVRESRCGVAQSLPGWAASRMRQGPPKKLLTLVVIHKDDRVLLGMKKRGFGKGYYNGFGGKVEKGETIDSAAARELQEESGVKPLDMSKRGILTFHFDNDPVPWEVHVYHVSEIVGEPHETEEMEPRWFGVSEIPYESMWSDDSIWYPEFLQGRQFQGDFYFENTTTLVGHSLRLTSLS